MDRWIANLRHETPADRQLFLELVFTHDMAHWKNPEGTEEQVEGRAEDETRAYIQYRLAQGAPMIGAAVMVLHWESPNAIQSPRIMNTLSFNLADWAIQHGDYSVAIHLMESLFAANSITGIKDFETAVDRLLKAEIRAQEEPRLRILRNNRFINLGDHIVRQDLAALRCEALLLQDNAQCGLVLGRRGEALEDGREAEGILRYLVDCVRHSIDMPGDVRLSYLQDLNRQIARVLSLQAGIHLACWESSSGHEDLEAAVHQAEEAAKVVDSLEKGQKHQDASAGDPNQDVRAEIISALGLCLACRAMVNPRSRSKDIQRADQIVEHWRDSQDDLGLGLLRGLLAVAKEDWKNAEEPLALFWDRTKESTTAAYAMRAAIMRGDLDQAQLWFEKLDPKDAHWRARYYRGLIEYRRKNFQGALTWWEGILSDGSLKGVDMSPYLIELYQHIVLARSADDRRSEEGLELLKKGWKDGWVEPGVFARTIVDELRGKGEFVNFVQLIRKEAASGTNEQAETLVDHLKSLLEQTGKTDKRRKLLPRLASILEDARCARCRTQWESAFSSGNVSDKRLASLLHSDGYLVLQGSSKSELLSEFVAQVPAKVSPIGALMKYLDEIETVAREDRSLFPETLRSIADALEAWSQTKLEKFSCYSSYSKAQSKAQRKAQQGIQNPLERAESIARQLRAQADFLELWHEAEEFLPPNDGDCFDPKIGLEQRVLLRSLADKAAEAAKTDGTYAQDYLELAAKLAQVRRQINDLQASRERELVRRRNELNSQWDQFIEDARTTRGPEGFEQRQKEFEELIERSRKVEGITPKIFAVAAEGVMKALEPLVRAPEPFEWDLMDWRKQALQPALANYRLPVAVAHRRNGIARSELTPAQQYLRSLGNSDAVGHIAYQLSPRIEATYVMPAIRLIAQSLQIQPNSRSAITQALDLVSEMEHLIQADPWGVRWDEVVPKGVSDALLENLDEFRAGYHPKIVDGEEQRNTDWEYWERLDQLYRSMVTEALGVFRRKLISDPRVEPEKPEAAQMIDGATLGDAITAALKAAEDGARRVVRSHNTVALQDAKSVEPSPTDVAGTARGGPGGSPGSGGTHYGTKETYNPERRPFLGADGKPMNFDEVHKVLVSTLIDRPETLQLLWGSGEVRRMDESVPLTDSQQVALEALQNILKGLGGPPASDPPVRFVLFDGVRKTEEFPQWGNRPYALLDHGDDILYAEGGAGGLREDGSPRNTRTVYLTQEFVRMLSTATPIVRRILLEEVLHADQKLQGIRRGEVWDDNRAGPLAELQEELSGFWAQVAFAGVLNEHERYGAAEEILNGIVNSHLDEIRGGQSARYFMGTLGVTYFKAYGDAPKRIAVLDRFIRHAGKLPRQLGLGHALARAHQLRSRERATLADTVGAITNYKEGLKNLKDALEGTKGEMRVVVGQNVSLIRSEMLAGLACALIVRWEETGDVGCLREARESIQEVERIRSGLSGEPFLRVEYQPVLGTILYLLGEESDSEEERRELWVQAEKWLPEAAAGDTPSEWRTSAMPFFQGLMATMRFPPRNDAIMLFEKCLAFTEYDPYMRDRVHLYLASVYLAKKDWQKATQELEQVKRRMWRADYYRGLAAMAQAEDPATEDDRRVALYASAAEIFGKLALVGPKGERRHRGLQGRSDRNLRRIRTRSNSCPCRAEAGSYRIITGTTFWWPCAWPV